MTPQIATWALYLVMVVLGVGIIYIKGRVDGAAGPNEELRKLAQASREQSDHYNDVLRKLRLQTSALQRTLKERDAELKKVLEKPFYRNGGVCLDDDGMRLVNDALADRPGTAD